MIGIEAVIFDLDGVLIDSEVVWERVRRAYVGESGGSYTASANGDVMGAARPGGRITYATRRRSR